VADRETINRRRSGDDKPLPVAPIIVDRMRNLRLVHSSTWLEHPIAEDPTDVDGLETSGQGDMDRQPACMEGNVPPLDPAVHAILGHVRIVAPLP
jgi:hypothetical protein